ncbi:protein spitz-like [Lucilia sericata]|uniref:protein spitz-like n=1 Tax=Lucilia sericata TaxID=13632 RepID=UPI0018A81958|nr:protein spitz-like [Lucilia sericata]XP_037822605.1 protein spitz-like [Lucilia sericata]XP_037822606.1 protein spitz-like [Lucilia sericata]
MLNLTTNLLWYLKPKFHFLFISCLLLLLHLTPSTWACSSRSLPKPRPINAPITTKAPTTTTARTTTTSTTTTTTTTPRPNITFPTFKCPANYDAWYCLNEATCFTVKIGDSIMYNCECAIGFMGPRCEYKELDGSYEPKRPRPILEKASIASGATCILLFLLFVCLTLYLRYDQKSAKIMYEEYDYTSTLAYNNCRFCTDKHCCSADDSNNDMRFLLNKDGKVSWLRHHIEAFPMGFSSKRFNKL